MIPPALERYIDFMSHLGPDSLQQLPSVVSAEIHFEDPFNSLRGREDFALCLHEMLQALDGLRIEVTHAAALQPVQPQSEPLYVLRWRFGGRLRALGGRPWEVTGMSEVALDDAGLVCRHVDYWDAARDLYGHLPLVGGLFRALRRRLGVRGARQY